MSRRLYTFDDVADTFVRRTAVALGDRYRHWGVDVADVQQELWLWLYGVGEVKVQRWLGNSPQQTTRINRSLWHQGSKYCEQEKAARVGYEVDDVQWYSESLVEGLLPLAQDPTFDGTPEKQGEPDAGGGRSNKLPEERSDLLTMVIDIRKAAEKVDSWDVQAIVDYLGGNRPFVGRRRPMSNAQCQAVTREND
ncbi:MAG: hypothetical protein ACXVXZ_13885 [Mycobacteriaceae bacterium]